MNERTRYVARIKRVVAAHVAAGLLLGGLPARAAEQTISLVSRGGHQSQKLPAGTTDVDLVEQTAGACRLGKTWGYDIAGRELWVDGGCGGRFKLTYAAGSGSDDADRSSGVGAAIAAAAVIAGIALIASDKDKDREKDRNNDWRNDDWRNDGWRNDDWRGGSSWNSRQIRGKGGLCLDIEGGARSGRDLIVYGCNGGGNQRFEWSSSGELRVAGLCLDVADRNTSDGARVIAYTCNGGVNQRWRRRGGEIRSEDSGKCLDIENGRARAGTSVIIYRCNGGDNQRWNW